MAPWMVIVGLIGSGFAVLLVAPTVHRRINARSRHDAERARLERVSLLRGSDAGDTRSFTQAVDAVKARDRLLLRGVRAELIDEHHRTLLVFRREDGDTVDSVIDELDTA